MTAAPPARLRFRLIRNFESRIDLKLFIVSGIAAVLLIRFYLHITGYRQIGGGTLHIAHMLWGGLLMMAGIILLLAYIGRGVRLWGALLGGVGFGTFIDEIGKFVTRDNDYFYRPAFSLMYVVFVVAYLVIQAIRSHRERTPLEYTVNALHELEEAAMHDLQRDEQERALRYLAAVQPPTALTAGLRSLIASLEPAAPSPVGRIQRTGAAALRRYRELARRPGFWRALVVFFIVQLAVKLLHVLIVVFRPEAGETLAAQVAFMTQGEESYVVAEWLQLGSSLVSAVFVARGIIALRTARDAALREFERSILVSVFVTQVFMFYNAQLAAVTVLAFNLLVLLGLGYMRAHLDEASRPPEPPRGGVRGGSSA
ncbi:MAG: hypothetical protein H0X64_09960 [Gemmatimonadaceae bacterium]|nr:hypothetical protein [Gemmatimonadaceae bacterium]